MAATTINFDNVPPQLRDMKIWVLWRAVPKEDGSIDKIPWRIDGLGSLAWGSAFNWLTFEEAKQTYLDSNDSFAGIGFIVPPRSKQGLHLTALDLDNAFNGDGLKPESKAICDGLNSYSEVSPSGTGLHIVTFADLPLNYDNISKHNQNFVDINGQAVEIYTHKHFVTFTGQRIEDYPATIETRSGEVKELYDKAVSICNSTTDKQGATVYDNIGDTQPTRLKDGEIIALAARAANADKFTKLMNGEIDGYPSQSEADEALCCILAYYTRDKAQIFRIIQRSKLFDDKWWREDYRDRTIGRALQLVQAKANGNGNSNSSEFENNHKHVSALSKINLRIPGWIAEHKFKTITDTERLYRYDHGVYLDNGETVLKGLIEGEFGDISSDSIVRDVIGKVKRRTYIERDQSNNRNILNVRNGLLNLETLELRQHTHEYFSTAQLGLNYNPEAKSPRIQKFLKEVAKAEDIPLIEEVIGWLLWPDYNVHKAVMLLGIGRNGKGTLLRLITAFLGKVNVSNVTLQDLVADRFAKADLYGKLANIGGDLPSKDLSDTAVFRSLTGSDDNRAQEKYRHAFTFRNKAKLLFSANVLPRSPDDTYAFYSRWILIEFLNIFNEEKGNADPDLDTKLQTKEELSGLLNIALNGLDRLRHNHWKFSYNKTVNDVEVMYKRNANPVYAFLMDECEPGDATDYIEKTLFYNKFKEYAQKNNLRPLSVTKFVELLKDQSEIPVTTFRPWIEYGDRPMCWQGVKFKSKYKKRKINHSKSRAKFQSRPSRVKPTPILSGDEGNNEKKVDKIGLKRTLDGVDCKPQITIGCHPRATEPTPTSTKCRACGYPIGPGNSSYYNTFCGSCGPQLAMVKAALKAHPEFSYGEIIEDLSGRGGRTPTKDQLPAMIEYLKEAKA